MRQTDPPRSARIIAPDVFTAVTPKGNQLRPHRTRRAFVWAINTTTPSCVTICTPTHAIRLLNTIFTIIARGICMRPGNSREVKADWNPEISHDMPSCHPRNHLTSRYDHEKLVWSVPKHPSVLPGTNKTTRHSVEQRQ